MNPDRTLLGVLRTRAAERPEAPALLGEDGVTFVELSRRADAAIGLLDRRVAPEASVAMIGPNHRSWVEAYYAVPGSGRLLTLLDHRLHGSELASMVERASTQLVVGERGHLDRFAPLVAWTRRRSTPMS